jgi:excisionase family DNA binding protein
MRVWLTSSVQVRAMVHEKYITIPELAKLLGVSRIAIYKRVKKGQIPATKIGRTYVITDQTIAEILGKELTSSGKERIDAAVRRTVREYGEVLKQLAKG